MSPYNYPDARHRRRHGPAGYSNVESFRPWLRDEFVFRCVYCLERETWSQFIAGFAVDHFLPVASFPSRRLDYANLLYACTACNAVKGSLDIPDPLEHLLSRFVHVRTDGHLVAHSRDARRLIDLMQLDRPAYVRRRKFVFDMVTLSQSHDQVLYRTLLGFPNDLPDLARLRPVSNSRPDGVLNSFHARRRRGELPEVY